MSNKIILAIEISEGYNSFQTFNTPKDAFEEKKKSEQRGEYPICIYDLNTRKYLWFDEDGPAYYETIAEAIIQKATR